jgi:hypothetical protein
MHGTARPPKSALLWFHTEMRIRIGLSTESLNPDTRAPAVRPGRCTRSRLAVATPHQHRVEIDLDYLSSLRVRIQPARDDYLFPLCKDIPRLLDRRRAVQRARLRCFATLGDGKAAGQSRMLNAWHALPFRSASILLQLQLGRVAARRSI